MKRKISALLLLFTFFTSTASASVLGSQQIDYSSLLVGKNTTLIKNTFLSDQSGVGLQTEYYAEYTPNAAVRPVVVTGESIWGKRTISQAISYMERNHMYPMLGINASFFSFQTGVPMGHVITNGEITSKDTTQLDAVGFNQDGSGFVSSLGIVTTAHFGEYEFDIAHINKYCQPTTNVMTLFTDKFGTTTKTKSETINVILGDIEGNLSIGQTLTGIVEEIKTVSGEIQIPSGKIVLTINTTGNEWIKTVLAQLTTGEQITITNYAIADQERWNHAYNGLASEGKRLLTNGVVTGGLEAGAAPRTAVGVKADGTLIFYVIDGRQTGHSYGVKQATLAERLKELGCVDALNLDGGGSTSIAGVYPGQEAASVMNSPSEGTLRQVTNFIFLQNMEEPTETLGGLYLYPYSTHYLSGSRVQLYPAAVDANFHYTPAPDVTYAMENDLGNITPEGVLTLSGTGTAKVTVSSGEITGSAEYFTYENPTSISVYNAETKEKITSIKAAANTRIKLDGHAYYGKKYLESTPEAYYWQVDASVGSITKDGVLTLSPTDGVSGNLTVWKGDAVVNIPVTVNGGTNTVAPADYYPYSEIRVYQDKIRVDMYSYHQPIDLENSYVKVDGEVWSEREDVQKYEADNRHAVIEIPVSETFETGFHKILAKAQTIDRFSDLHKETVQNTVLANHFTDTTGHWAENTIAYMNLQNIVNGDVVNNQSVFYPDKSMTRAEFAVMMCNYLQIDASEYEEDESPFDDKNEIPAWASNAIKAMADIGIISGKQNGDRIYFAPTDRITRAETAAIIGRTLPDTLRAGELAFSDVSTIPAWAKQNMAVLTNAKFISGYPDKTIRPNGQVTRAEAVTILFNVY